MSDGKLVALMQRANDEGYYIHLSQRFSPEWNCSLRKASELPTRFGFGATAADALLMALDVGVAPIRPPAPAVPLKRSLPRYRPVKVKG